MQISGHIHTLRVTKKLTQEEFAASLGVAAKVVSKWEEGELLPDLDIIIKMSKQYNVSTDYLLKGQDNRLKRTILFGSILIFISLTLLAFLPLLAENLRHKNAVLAGVSYTNSINYLFEPPLCYLLFLGLLLFATGVGLCIYEAKRSINSEKKKEIFDEN